MATKFVKQATAQLNPVYASQEKAISSQVPAIQNLYNTLIQGLQGQYDQNLQTGVQGIVEDASARGVLRSTLPVDARQALTAQLGQALMTGRAQLGSQQAQDIAGINEKLGTLRIQKTGAIADLARALEGNDLDRQKFAYQKKADARDFTLKQQQLAIQRAASSAKSTGFDASIATSIDATLGRLVGSDGKVSPSNYNQAKVLWVSQGGKVSDFNAIFGPKYAVGASSPLEQYYK